MSEEQRDQLRLDVAVMRELGILEWNDIRLGPPQPATDAEESTQPSITPEEADRRQRAERMRLATAAGGGPRLKLGHGQ